MDGIDWMTVAETVPIAGAIVLLGLLDAVSALPTLVALALLGAMLGFAPFNRPVARLFLGDVGSLPIGLLLAWLLLRVAANGYIAAAIILPLYYIADATLTLGRRLANGERVWQAHRSHFYQRALDGGFSVTEVVARVLLVNCALVALALIAVADAGGIISWGALGAGRAIRRLAAGGVRDGKILMRVLVTGASGFVGRALVNDLAAQGHRVRAAMRQPADIFARDGRGGGGLRPRPSDRMVAAAARHGSGRTSRRHRACRIRASPRRCTTASTAQRLPASPPPRRQPASGVSSSSPRSARRPAPRATTC